MLAGAQAPGASPERWDRRFLQGYLEGPQHLLSSLGVVTVRSQLIKYELLLRDVLFGGRDVSISLTQAFDLDVAIHGWSGKSAVREQWFSHSVDSWSSDGAVHDLGRLVFALVGPPLAKFRLY